jgi:hypothetical protein
LVPTKIHSKRWEDFIGASVRAMVSGLSGRVARSCQMESTPELLMTACPFDEMGSTDVETGSSVLGVQMRYLKVTANSAA